jgi:glycosyltransferase involved in cell wall biosynthesis
MAPAIDEALRRLPIRSSRFVYQTVVGVAVPPGAEAASLRHLRDELGLAPTDRIVLTVGRLEPRKSHHLFVAAAATIAAHRDDVQFLIAGDGALEEDLRRQISAAGLGDRVRLLGSRRDVDTLLELADVYVRPTVVEGFIGITVLEAQALRVPVVSFETEDVKLAITDGISGLLVPKNDTDGLAAAIEDVLDDHDLASRIGAAGHETMLGRYEITAVVDQLVRLYTSILAERDR